MYKVKVYVCICLRKKLFKCFSKWLTIYVMYIYNRVSLLHNDWENVITYLHTFLSTLCNFNPPPSLLILTATRLLPYSKAIIRDAITSSRNFLPEDKYRHISEGLSNLIKLIDKDMLPKVEALIRSKDQYIWDSFNTYYNEHPTINILTIPWLVSECSLVSTLRGQC